MNRSLTHRMIRLLCASSFAAMLAAFGCADSQPQPAQPTPPEIPAATYQTITITAAGITPSRTFITPGQPLLIVNNDTRPHRLHLGGDGDQPGCEGFDLAGEVPAGQSRLTGVIGQNAVECQIHDHMNHGDDRFEADLLVSVIGG